MDLGPAGFAGAFLWDLLNIIIINLVLSGDNAVLIAMAVRSLPPHLRGEGFQCWRRSGRGAANRAYLHYLGGPRNPLCQTGRWERTALGRSQTLRDGFPGGEEKEAATLFHAIKIMVIADLTMSLDNVIAVAGASHGNLFPDALRAGSFHPFRYLYQRSAVHAHGPLPVIIYIGAAIVGRVGAEMMMSRPGPDRLYQSSRCRSLWIRGFLRGWSHYRWQARFKAHDRR